MRGIRGVSILRDRASAAMTTAEAGSRVDRLSRHPELPSEALRAKQTRRDLAAARDETA
jgi:hypothetical protein